MSLSKILAKFKLNTFDLIPISLYAISIFIAIQESKEVMYMYSHCNSSVTYSPYRFTLYILFPTFAFLTILNSSLIKVPLVKIKFITFSYLCLAFVMFSMFAQLSNELIQYFVENARPKIDSVPFDMLSSAIRASTFYVPVIITFYLSSLFGKLLAERDAKTWIPQLNFNLYSKDVEPTGPLTCDVTVCIDAKTGNPITTPESKRMEATLIQGATGTGKTSTLLLPMGCIDIERKYFFRELSKELGYRALEKGCAYIDAPLSNEELNRHFSLKLLKPLKGKEEPFEKEIKDLIKYKDSETGEILFRDLGVGAIDPDGEYVKNFRNIAKNFGINCIIVDPMHEDSVGINPFIGKDPAKIASIISTVLKGMYESENPGDSNLFFAQVTQQAIENLSILLKVMYSKMHNGLLPTIEDMLQMLHRYELVEEMCEELKRDPILAEEYKILIAYFEKNFYKPPLNDRGMPIAGGVGSGRRVTEQFLYGATTQLDNLLRQHNVKRVVCSRSNNIDFDDILSNGKCLTVCSRRGPLGGLLSKAFGMFFILAFQDAVLRRPGSEKTRTPFFLYIDEFPDFVNKETETCFTLFRKYRCGLIVAIQNLSQLERSKSMAYYKQVVLANAKTQLIFGDTNVEDTLYWAEAFGKDLMWSVNNSVSGGPDNYSETTSQAVSWDHLHTPLSIHYQPFKYIKYKTKNSKGKTVHGDGKTNFVDSKYYQEHPSKFYNFEKFKVYSPFKDHVSDPDPQYDSISTSFSQVEAEVSPSPQTSKQVFDIQVNNEPGISLGKNIRADIKNDKISNEEMNALKELITEIHSDDAPHVDDFAIEMGNSLIQTRVIPDIIDIQPVEEDQAENLNILDKTGKIKIEVKQN